MKRVQIKWRPPLVLAVVFVCAGLLIVPVGALLALQIGTNAFIRETESALIKQAAIYAGVYASAFEQTSSANSTPGYYLPPQKRVFWNAETRTFDPLLDLRSTTIEPIPPDATPSDKALDARYRRIAAELAKLADRAGRTTLSSVIFLDFQGLDLLAPTPVSFIEIPEVAKSLQGEVGAALRWRSDADARWPLLSLSRGSGFRVLISYPVISANRVIGAIYMSRTPPKLESYFTQESTALIALVALTIAAVLVVGFFLARVVLRPIMALRTQAYTL